MTFGVEWHSNSRKFLRKLPSDVAKRIVKKIKELKENPFRYLKHYEGEGYKFRIGDYRALINADIGGIWYSGFGICGEQGRVYKK